MRNLVLIASIALLAQACLFGKKDDPTTCRTNDECASKVCNPTTYYCEPVGGVDSGLPQGGMVGTGGSGGTSGAGGSAGAAADGSLDSPPDTGIFVDAPLDQRVPDVAIDTRVPDAAGTCGVNSDCPDPAKSFCVAGVCVGCQSGLDGGANFCTAPTSVCDSLTGRCVGCTASSHCATPATPICDTTKNICVGCAVDLQCQTKNPTLAACRSDGQCVQCTATTASTSCIGTTPACDITTNTCVQCMTSANCTGATPICGINEKCQACATDPDCAGLNDPARVACAAGGACVQCTATNATKCGGTTSVCNVTINTCVQCLTNATCSGSTPICATATNTCRGCTKTSDCSTFAGHTACAATGACVQCTDNSTCSGTTPICATTTNACRKCSADSECSGVGPSVCMTDGHCATDAETVYVGALGTATCSESNAGTAQAPVCSLLNGVGLARTGAKPVVAVRGALAAGSANIAVNSPLTIVGKSGGTITSAAATSADAITITSGEIYLRNLTIQGTASPATGMGINAIAGTTLHMDTCAVINNPGGGILLNGAAFDFKNVTVNGNGPGQTTGGTPWGGIRVDALPSSGTTNINLVTINTNNPAGLSCAGGIQGTGVLSTGNTSIQISTSCGVTACTPGSTTCGVQSQPQ